jgi:hypothetical protein
MAKQVVLCFLLAVHLTSAAQSPCGVFASHLDFLESKVAYKFDDCNFRIAVNKDIVARHEDQRLRFDFDFIFGYTDGNNLYRAYSPPSLWTNRGYYQVIYDEGVVIYARTLKDHRSNVYTFFFYSLERDSPIYPLRPKYYDTTSGKTRLVKLKVASLKEHLGIPSEEENFSAFVNEWRQTP